MKKIDAHQHFWKFDPVRDSWITEEMSAIRRDFMPQDLEPLLKANGFDGCVVVQSDQSEAENSFQLDNAERHEFIHGVVGWIDLRSRDVEDKLSYYTQFPKFKGFRHVLQGEPNRALMLHPDFMNGISKLRKHSYTYDILIFPDQLGYTKEFVAAFPDQPFVIDHIAKPHIKEKEIKEWERDIRAVAQYENVYCKISGMVTEADWHHWKADDFTSYLDVMVEAFGTDRIMFGSDWPVCEVAATYAQVVDIVKDYFSTFSNHEQAMFFGGNAKTFYRLD